MAERVQALESILSRRTHNFEVTMTERTKQLDTTLAQRAQALETSIAQQTGSIRDTIDKQAGSMEHTLARQAAAIERVVTQNSANMQRAVEELASRSNTGSDALSGQARVLKEVSATLVNQLGGLTQRFEEQGKALVNASRTFEMSNSKVDAMMEQRQAGFSKLMENVSARAGELDRMMNSYSNMLEQSLSQAELRARKVTELLAKDSAEKSQVAIREIERLREDAQVHTQKAVSELQANFSSLTDQVSSQLTNLSSKFSDTTRVVRDNDTARLGGLGDGSDRASAPREGLAGNRQAKRHGHAARAAGPAIGPGRTFRSFDPAHLLQRCVGSRAETRAAAAGSTGAAPSARRSVLAPANLRLRSAAERQRLGSRAAATRKAIPARTGSRSCSDSAIPRASSAGTPQSVVAWRPAGAGVRR